MHPHPHRSGPQKVCHHPPAGRDGLTRKLSIRHPRKRPIAYLLFTRHSANGQS
jgi:hypothetical protein